MKAGEEQVKWRDEKFSSELSFLLLLSYINFFLNHTFLSSFTRCRCRGKKKNIKTKKSSGLILSWAFPSFSMREIDKFCRKLEIYLSKIVTRDKLSLLLSSSSHAELRDDFSSVKAILFSLKINGLRRYG